MTQGRMQNVPATSVWDSIGRVLFQAVPVPVCFPVLFALIGPVTVRFAVTLDEIASRSLQKSGT